MTGERFRDRAVVVTGGGSGIGAATARAFGAEGAAVTVADRSADAAGSVAASILASGGQARALTLDVARSEDVTRAFAAMDGPLDALVCAAGVFRAGAAETLSDDAWREVLEVNLSGTFYCARAALPALRAARGAIVTFTSSTGAHDAIPGAAAYVAAKGGVAMLTKALAVDHAADGVRANAIAPGPTDTPMLRALMDDDALSAFGRSLPVGRLGTPEEVAAAALFLASDAAAFITGAVLAVDGGQTALIGGAER